MITTGIKFTPSINILRDEEKELSYIPTPNTESVFKQLADNYSSGFHSFNVIGSYGTGKSLFLWALEKHLKGERFFSKNFPGTSKNGSGYKFLKIVGDYRSILKSFGSALRSEEDGSRVLDALQRLYSKCRRENEGLIILIDEFGKFLEYAAKNNPEEELYSLQKIAEFANDTDKNILLIVTLHQNFDAYTRGLSTGQRLEWEKVKGRFKEIAFSEPVEQLLFLAAACLSGETGGPEPIKLGGLSAAIKESQAFPFDNSLIDELAKKLFPLDMLSAALLTRALQKYGQNERSLFTFLASRGETGIENIKELKESFYHIGCVYDYLIRDFYYYLFTKYNPDYLQWTAVRSALERAEPFLGDKHFDAAKLIKTIGLLNIFASKAAAIDEAFLLKYGNISLGIKDPGQIIEQLKNRKIIRYREFNRCFVLFEGTDLDIDMEIRRAGSSVDLPGDTAHKLQEYFYFPHLMARAVYFKLGTPRFFSFRLSMEPVREVPTGETDGIINLVFNPELENESILGLSGNCREAILFGLFQKPGEIKEILLEIEKIKHVINIHPDDRVAQKELKTILAHLVDELNKKMMNHLYESKDITWIFNGQVQSIKSKREFNRLLSSICEKIYPHTPLFLNELINRHKLSGTISSARKNFFHHLVNHWREKDLGFPGNKYPPEKAIYLSLLKETGIQKELEFSMTLDKPAAPSFLELWEACENFLYSTRKHKRNAADLIETLTGKPFKLKNGFVEFWLPLYFFIKRDDYALFSADIYVPHLNLETLQLLTRKPQKYSIKAFDVDGVRIDLFNRYRMIVKQDSRDAFTNSVFIETIRPFLVFYTGLPEYTKQTERLSRNAMALRDALSSAREPEKTFFEDLPRALGFSISGLSGPGKDLETFVRQLQEGIRELRNCYDALLDRIEGFLLNELGTKNLSFEAYKTVVQERFRSIKEYLLLPHQKTFYTRLFSEIEDRKTWLKSLIQGLLGKSPGNMVDRDEPLLHEKIKDIIFELDSLCEFAGQSIDPEVEEFFKIKLVSSVGGLKKKILRCPKEKVEGAEKLQETIKSKLTKDKKTNIIALLSLLKDEMNDE